MFIKAAEYNSYENLQSNTNLLEQNLVKGHHNFSQFTVFDAHLKSLSTKSTQMLWDIFTDKNLRTSPSEHFTSIFFVQE